MHELCTNERLYVRRAYWKRSKKPPDFVVAAVDFDPKVFFNASIWLQSIEIFKKSSYLEHEKIAIL